jgi:hypothetical protein
MERQYRRLASNESAAPFVIWPEDPPATIEGVVEGRWMGQHGEVLRLRVESAYSGPSGDGDLQGVMGAASEQQITPVRPDDLININLSPAGLRHLTGVPVGVGLRIVFAGTRITKAKKRMRLFDVEIERDVEFVPTLRANNAVG